ncbi:Hypothetical predicted protein [Mytilus galloprovincialis]|uniref:DIX domain-containing protein n=1 Tax=Mytilus galloprovincialis TaxID=29158 RepID=A0A8B6H836_MYTGA|nr:Hypothetical predicted protein [Mytilus galloprovincialis]
MIPEEIISPLVQECLEEPSHPEELGVIKSLPPVPPDPTSTKEKDIAQTAKPIEGPKREPISLIVPDMSESGSQDEESGEEGEQTLCDSSNSDGEGDLVTEGEREMITISQLTGGTMYRVPVVVQGHRVAAVVDTAAQVTLISEEMYKSLKEPPPILKEVVMNTAGKGLQMNGFVAGPFYIKLGNQEFTWDIYVAPIGDQMLLGIDFLRKQGISLDLHRNQLSIHGEVIQMSWGQASSLPQTTEVRAGKNHTVPANSVQRVMGVLAKPMGREYIIMAKAEGCLLIPRTLHDIHLQASYREHQQRWQKLEGMLQKLVIVSEEIDHLIIIVIEGVHTMRESKRSRLSKSKSSDQVYAKDSGTELEDSGSNTVDRAQYEDLLQEYMELSDAMSNTRRELLKLQDLLLCGEPPDGAEDSPKQVISGSSPAEQMVSPKQVISGSSPAEQMTVLIMFTYKYNSIPGFSPNQLDNPSSRTKQLNPQPTTKVLYFTDRTVNPSMCTIHKRLGEITLKDFKDHISVKGNYRYSFKALDPEFGTVKEEVMSDDDKVPGWEGQIVAWVEEDTG